MVGGVKKIGQSYKLLWAKCTYLSLVTFLVCVLQ